MRDVKLRYRQTALGVAWVVLLPLLASGIFTLVFGVVAGLPSDGSPYFLFVFAGYLGDDAATAKAMAGEWLRTGDLVHRDAAGVFRVVDRIKDIYISGGENVAPAEVEYALGLHPLVESLPRSSIEKLARSRLRDRARDLLEGVHHDHSR